MSTTETNRRHLVELLEGLSTGRLMEVFEKFYADDVVMMENGEPDPARVGKAGNRTYEQYFADKAEWHGAKMGPVIVDGDHSAYEMWMDFTIDGQRVVRSQVAMQWWKDGQIVKEIFYYKA
ncbi:MAG: nuclear transport factor 2 family protein [Myxococcales bacterium]|nr:nuclear transport factor 2 family protein [Myxococcales bacterium]